MTPVERLQAAIDLLEQQRAATQPVRADSQWVVDYDPVEVGQRILVLDSHNGGHDGSIVAEATSKARAHLIVTLHRTIEAQLLILQHALARAEAKIAGGGIAHAVWSHERDALTLADAILNTPALAEGADPNTHDSKTGA